MLYERIYLDPQDDRVYIDAYVADHRTSVRDAMLVIPGGGYRNVCTDREGEPIALGFMAEGMNCFVLNYRVGREGDVYSAQLIDASRAIVHIRANAEKYNINPNRVFAVGFSAGGHLAGSLALLSSDSQVLDALGIKEGENTPDGVVLSYPVVNPATHEISFVNLTGKPVDMLSAEESEKLSLENHVGKASPPAFIWHTAEDTVVDPAGSLSLAAAYVKAGARVAFKLYPYGPHGLALANSVTADGNDRLIQPLAQGWISDARKFFDTI